MGNHALAINDFHQAIQIDPDLSEGYFRRGFSKFYSKNNADAIADFKKAEEKENDLIYNDPSLKDEDRNAGIPDGLGCCYHALGQYEVALRYYDTAIEMNKKNTQFLMHRAQCFYDQGLYENSIGDLSTGFEINPTDP